MKKLRASCLLTFILFCCTIGATSIVKQEHHAHQWRGVLQKTINTVVQIFASKFEKDLLEPYMMPYQQSSRGSGFFIQYNGKIYIVTNAHVVDQAASIQITIPCFGQKLISCEIVGICPNRDLALLKITEEEEVFVRKGFNGTIPFLTLGHSDELHRADQVLAVGYPLGEKSIKTTCGVYCGHQAVPLMPDQLLQIDAPINPGSSGGPLLNINGEVVGINTVLNVRAQNAGYSIPTKKLALILPQLVRQKLVKRPSLGIVTTRASHVAECLGNPTPSGAYLSEVIEGGPCDKAGIKKGDMMYQINGHTIDEHGDIIVPWTEDRLSISDYVSSLGLEDDIVIVVYRNGERLEFTANFVSNFKMGIRHISPGYEEIDYEVFAGMVVMELTLNHIEIMSGDHGIPGLKEYGSLKNQHKPVLIVTHVLPSSALYLSQTISIGVILNEVNDMPVSSLEDFRTAIKKTPERKFLTLRATDTVGGLTDNLYVALKTQDIIKQEPSLSAHHRYALSPTVKNILNEASKL